MMTFREFMAQKDVLFKKDYARSPLYAKVFCHKVTPYLVYLAYRIGWSPNGVTFAAFVMGLVSVMFMASPNPGSVLVGALFYEFYYLLDSVDGQLARFTKKYSKTGAYFDILGNYIVQPLLFIALGYGCYADSGRVIFLILGVFAGLGHGWMGMLWEVRGHVLLRFASADGLKLKVPAATTLPAASETSLIKRAFSILHKICTFPSVMNAVTVLAILSCLIGDMRLFGLFVIFYGAAMPLVSGLKIAKIVASSEVDDAYGKLAA